MTAAAGEVLDRLLALFAHDQKIRRLDEDLDRTPARVQERRASMAVLDEKVRALATKLQLLKAQMRLRENELRGHEQKVQRLKQQSSEVRTNREFVAFRSEIANAQAEADRLQGEILKILEVVQQAEARITELEGQRAKEEEGIAQDQARMDSELVQSRSERDDLLAARGPQLDGIPPEALEQYERARQARGDGLAALEGTYCGACGDVQTKNDVYAVQNRTRLVPCKGCNRILYLV